MDEAIRQFLEHLKNQRGRSENTILAYARDLTQFNAILKQAGVHSEPETIPIEVIERYLDWLSKQNYKSSTIARKCTAVRGFFEFWRSDEILPLNSIDNQLRDIQTTRRSPRVLLKEQIEELLAAPAVLKSPLRLRDTAILSLMYKTGSRPTDIIQLMLDDIDLLGKRIRLPSQGMKALFMGEAADNLEEYLHDGRPHLARIPEERSLFLNQRGKGLTRQGVWFIVRRWAKAAHLGEKISPNTLRHSLIQHLIDSGYNNKEILRRLGMKSPNSLRAFNTAQRKVGDE
ncbi:MAG: hypothetical protein A2Z14_09080 [Chloroflexi bacterium RBG_16_48_8]|nr:MAG: hypothetical protein A2Z14_09080 [Chloroflexi bacterium RBG_16_48_8]